MTPTPAEMLTTAMQAMKAELAAVEKVIAQCRYELRQHRQGSVAASLLNKFQKTLTDTLASPEWQEIDPGMNRRQNRVGEIEKRLAGAISRRDKLRAQARDAGVLI